jgi:hypothetical protein
MSIALSQSHTACDHHVPLPLPLTHLTSPVWTCFCQSCYTFSFLINNLVDGVDLLNPRGFLQTYLLREIPTGGLIVPMPTPKPSRRSKISVVLEEKTATSVTRPCRETARVGPNWIITQTSHPLQPRRRHGSVAHHCRPRCSVSSCNGCCSTRSTSHRPSKAGVCQG